jgi:hypothetical protein
LQVTWGDGQSDSESLGEGVRTFSLDHVYGDDGSYSVQVTITDKDGGRAKGDILLLQFNAVVSAL